MGTFEKVRGILHCGLGLPNSIYTYCPNRLLILSFVLADVYYLLVTDISILISKGSEFLVSIFKVTSLWYVISRFVYYLSKIYHPPVGTLTMERVLSRGARLRAIFVDTLHQ